MTKVFFSYASEDIAAVDAVYDEVARSLPRYEPWLAKYQIVGGEDLLAKIAAGMDEAHKFVIFLSETSISKPWVQAELRRAIMREIVGVDPAHIVPVKIGTLGQMPAFLEHKLYIDLPNMTRQEWLAAFEAAISGSPQLSPGTAENIRVTLMPDPDGPHAIRVVFEAVAWAEEFSFVIATNADIVQAHLWEGGAFRMVTDVRQPRVFGYRFESPKLAPGKSFSFRLVFEDGVDARRAVAQIARWEPS
jgi:hypothetical protein